MTATSTQKQTMRKSHPHTGFEPAAFGLPVRAWYGMEADFFIFHTSNFLPFLFHSIQKSSIQY